MELLYKQELPFEYRMYNEKKTDIPLSDEIKREFNHFYGRIKESDSLDVDRLKKEYEAISSLVVSEIRKAGNDKLKHVLEEIQFIFACSYLLMKKYGVSQGKLASIWGINKNKFSELDIYPDRSYAAYAKEDYKPLSPLREKSKGVQIAEFINKNVQAVHACRGFVGVTNDLDVFANISSTDTKAFVLTSPLDFGDDEIGNVKRANYAFARYLFAQGNRLFGDDGKYVPAGCIKDKIISLLNMQDVSVMEQDGVLKEILMSDADLGAYLTDGGYGEFGARREKYKSAVEVVQIKNEMLEYGLKLYGIEYEDPRFGAIIPGGDEMAPPPTNMHAKADKTTEEIVIEKAEEAQKQIDLLEPQLIGCLDVRRTLGGRKDVLGSWIRFLKKSVAENTIILQPSFDDRVRAAAAFWISEVFKGREADGESVDKALDYLKGKDLLSYIDSLNAPPSGKMKDAGQDCKGHIYVISEEHDIFMELQSKPSIKLSGKDDRPLMLYIDTEAHPFSLQDMEQFLANVKAIIIAHDSSGSVGGMGMQLLNKELGLYMRNSLEER